MRWKTSRAALPTTPSFDDGITVAGSIDGGAGGTDTLSFVNFTTAVSLAVSTFSDIENLIGSAVTTDEIVGANTPNTWTITGNGTGDINGIAYTAFEDFTGGTNVDTYNVNDGLDKELSEEDIAHVVASAPIENMSDVLVDRAVDRDARDNVTVVCVQVSLNATEMFSSEPAPDLRDQ